MRYVTQPLLGGGEIGTSRLDGASHAPKEVDLPAGVEARLEQVLLRFEGRNAATRRTVAARSRRQSERIFTEPLPGVGPGYIDRGSEPPHSDATQGTRLAHARFRRAQIPVRLDGASDEGIEQRILERRPPLGSHRFAHRMR